jgi:hypothetical protein
MHVYFRLPSGQFVTKPYLFSPFTVHKLYTCCGYFVQNLVGWQLASKCIVADWLFAFLAYWTAGMTLSALSRVSF